MGCSKSIIHIVKKNSESHKLINSDKKVDDPTCYMCAEVNVTTTRDICPNCVSYLSTYYYDYYLEHVNELYYI